jgi:hypothetical protein
VRLHNRLLVVSGSVQTFLPLPLHCSARQPENATALFHERIPFFRVPASRGTSIQENRSVAGDRLESMCEGHGRKLCRFKFQTS